MAAASRVPTKLRDDALRSGLHVAHMLSRQLESPRPAKPISCLAALAQPVCALPNQADQLANATNNFMLAWRPDSTATG